jgi:D-lactate dehydrogenase
VLTDDPEAHLRHLKTFPAVEEEVDRCVECGYCEPVCPSRDLTTTPRQRIVLRREIAAARAAGDDRLARQLEREYRYDAVQTCAVDGMCATACPVLIDTGDLTRRLRGDSNGRTAQAGWDAAARHWGGVTRTLAAGLGAAGALPPIAEAATRAAGAVLPGDSVPRWSRDLPRGGTARRPTPAATRSDADAVYLPSCLNTLFAPAGGGDGVMAALLRLAERAGLRLSVPDGIGGLCCGTPWSSKGFARGYRTMRGRVADRLDVATDGGRLPVVSDASSCTEGFARLTAAAAPGIRVLDAVAFTAESVLPRLPAPRRRLPSLVLHPTCSGTRLGLDPALLAVARAVAEDVVVPDGWQCCGFAGDRGMLHPELTASATRAEAASVARSEAVACASVNRTCELAMSRATGRDYRHLLELLDELTRPGPAAGGTAL